MLCWPRLPQREPAQQRAGRWGEAFCLMDSQNHISILNEVHQAWKGHKKSKRNSPDPTETNLEIGWNMVQSWNERIPFDFLSSSISFSRIMAKILKAYWTNVPYWWSETPGECWSLTLCIYIRNITVSIKGRNIFYNKEKLDGRAVSFRGRERDLSGEVLLGVWTGATSSIVDGVEKGDGTWKRKWVRGKGKGEDGWVGSCLFSTASAYYLILYLPAA